MRPKNLIVLFIFGLFLFLLPSFVEGACQMTCVPDQPSVCYNKDCCWSNVLAIDQLLVGVERIGIIGNISQCSVYEPTTCGTSSCSSSVGKCKESGFPAGNNGQNCIAMDRELSGVTCNNCFTSGY